MSGLPRHGARAKAIGVRRAHERRNAGEGGFPGRLRDLRRSAWSRGLFDELSGERRVRSAEPALPRGQAAGPLRGTRPTSW